MYMQALWTTCVVKQKQKLAANLFSRKQGSGISIHIKVLFTLIHIDWYILLVYEGQLYCPCYCSFLGSCSRLLPIWSLSWGRRRCVCSGCCYLACHLLQKSPLGKLSSRCPEWDSCSTAFPQKETGCIDVYVACICLVEQLELVLLKCLSNPNIFVPIDDIFTR